MQLPCVNTWDELLTHALVHKCYGYNELDLHQTKIKYEQRQWFQGPFLSINMDYL